MSSTDVVVEKVGDRIHLYSGYFPGVAEMCKAVPGHTPVRDPDTNRFKNWSYPLNMRVCIELRRVFTDMLVIGPELSKWATAEKRRQAALAHLAEQTDATLRRVPAMAPRMAQAMAGRTYQRVGARFIADAREVLLADEVTLGKTIQYLGGLIEGGVWEGQHLIVAPKSSLETVWADEVRKWTDGHPFWMPEGRAKREEMLRQFVDDDAPAKFLIINPEMLQVKMVDYCKKCSMWEIDLGEDLWPTEHYQDAHKVGKEIYRCEWPGLFEIQWNSVCVDEAHKYLLGLRGRNNKTQAAEGFTRLQIVEGGMKIAATGTPLKGKAINFWSIFHWLRPKDYASKWQWADMYLTITENAFGKTIGDVKPGREQDLYASLTDIMLRRTKREVQPELPEDQYFDHWVSMSAKQSKQYHDMLSYGESQMESGTLTATGMLAEFTRLKQLSFGVWNMQGGEMTPTRESPKLDFLLDQLARRGVTGNPDTDFQLEGGYKYIVASQFTQVVDMIEEALRSEGIDTLKITGAVTGAKRIAAQRAFQSEDGPRVLLLNTIAGGSALTLDAHCDEMFIMDETWVHDEQAQVEGRIRNRDVEKRVAVRTFHYIRTKGTIEQDIADSGLSQDEFQKKLLDKRRGVEFARRVIKAA